MYHLKYYAGGAATSHPKGHVYSHPGHIEWLFMRFLTPFYYIIDGVRYEGSVGDCLLQPPGTPLIHGAPEELAEGFVNDWLFFYGDGADELVRACRLPLNRAFAAGDSAGIQKHIAALVREEERLLYGAELKQSCEIVSLLVDLRRELLPEKTDDTAYRILSETRDYVLAHTEENWTLAAMAKRTGYSQSQFTMLYRRFFDSSPTADLIRARVINARNLLLYSEHSVSRISELCGFASAQYFTRTYRALTGESPSETKKGRGRG